MSTNIKHSKELEKNQKLSMMILSEVLILKAITGFLRIQWNRNNLAKAECK